MQALSLAKECYSMKLDLLTNATAVDDAIRFVSQKSKEKLKSTNSSSEDDNESKAESNSPSNNSTSRKILIKNNNFIDTKEFDKAIECFDEALKINPNFDDALKQKNTIISMYPNCGRKRNQSLSSVATHDAITRLNEASSEVETSTIEVDASEYSISSYETHMKLFRLLEKEKK